METSLKTGFAQIFSCCPKNLSRPKFGGAAAPLAPPARTPMNPGCLDKNFAPCVSLCAQGYMYTRRKKNLQYSSLPFRQAVLTFCMLVHIEHVS